MNSRSLDNLCGRVEVSTEHTKSCCILLAGKQKRRHHLHLTCPYQGTSWRTNMPPHCSLDWSTCMDRKLGLEEKLELSHLLYLRWPWVIPKAAGAAQSCPPRVHSLGHFICMFPLLWNDIANNMLCFSFQWLSPKRRECEVLSSCWLEEEPTAPCHPHPAPVVQNTLEVCAPCDLSDRGFKENTHHPELKGLTI